MWFNQSIQKTLRRKKRIAKAKVLYPCPLKKLKPVVNCQSQRYQNKKKLGRGFTIEELAEAGFKSVNEAKSLRIAVDQKRKNKSNETYEENVLRLKEYMSKVKNYESKEAVKNDNIKLNTKEVLPFQKFADQRIQFIDSKNLKNFSI
ncbi:large ribosomal subunit protein eL13 [Lepeophtheirus salmonis]|uniref:large ribosomal subunit protein eL13 n=1 Tax=Lepeophtheirus salmonis TaxID=72036 RepID=UPI001AE36527|nr:60S ribosomal protein L13-like [Lepeophtheirus salmonis]